MVLPVRHAERARAGAAGAGGAGGGLSEERARGGRLAAASGAVRIPDERGGLGTAAADHRSGLRDGGRAGGVPGASGGGAGGTGADRAGAGGGRGAREPHCGGRDVPGDVLAADRRTLGGRGLPRFPGVPTGAAASERRRFPALAAVGAARAWARGEGGGRADQGADRGAGGAAGGRDRGRHGARRSGDPDHDGAGSGDGGGVRAGGDGRSGGDLLPRGARDLGCGARMGALSAGDAPGGGGTGGGGGAGLRGRPDIPRPRGAQVHAGRVPGGAAALSAGADDGAGGGGGGPGICTATSGCGPSRTGSTRIAGRGRMLGAARAGRSCRSRPARGSARGLGLRWWRGRCSLR